MTHNKKIIAYSLHGGSTKTAGTAGAAVAAARLGYAPDVIIGVSGGACLAIPFALGMYDECLRFSREINLNEWFDTPVTNGAGKPSKSAVWRVLRSAWHALTGRKAKDGAVYSLGVQNTRKAMERIITPELFDKYRTGSYAPVYIVSVNWNKRKLEVRNAKELTYDQYHEAMHNSAALPVATQGGRFNGGSLEFDGGVFTQNAAWWLLSKCTEWQDKITDLVTIYVTPDNNELPNMEDPDHLGEAAMGCIELMSNRLYMWDDETEERLCREKGVTRHEIRLPIIIGTGAANKYNNSPEALEYLQRLGAIEAQKVMPPLK